MKFVDDDDDDDFDFSNSKVTSSNAVLWTLPNINVNHAAFVVYFFCLSPSFYSYLMCELIKLAVASLGLVSPVAATDGYDPIFLLKNSITFLVIASESDDLFSCCFLTTPIFPRRLSSVHSKFSHTKINFRSGVTPSGGCHPGRTRSAPPP